MTGEPSGRAAAPHVEIVDGLRGLAIALVVLFHYWQLSWWALQVPGVPQLSLEFVQYAGHLGVELFFFISAFCLCHPHAKAMLGLGPVPTLAHFVRRRALKILPSYLLALAVFGLFFPTLYPAGNRYGLPADVALHLTFLHNLFPETRSSFVGVFWSLAVEVQFYVLFPLLALAFRRAPWLTTAGMVALAVGYRAWARGLPLDAFPHWDSMLPGFLDLFALGMLAAYLLVWVRQRVGDGWRLRHAATLLAVAAAGALLTLFEWTFSIRYEAPAEVWQSHHRLPIGVLLVVVTVASPFAVGVWRRVLAHRVLVALSAISYNLYLWHQAVGLVIRDRGWWPASTTPPMEDPEWRWSYTLVAVAVSIGIAALITYAVERPILRLGVRGAVRTWTAPVAARVRRWRPVPVPPATSGEAVDAARPA